MVVKMAMSKRTAMARAMKARKMGYVATVYKTAKGWMVSVTRKK